MLPLHFANLEINVKRCSKLTWICISIQQHVIHDTVYLEKEVEDETRTMDEVVVAAVTSGELVVSQFHDETLLLKLEYWERNYVK